MKKIVGQIKSVWPDRTQYKPYAYNLTFDNVFVELEVAEDTKITDITMKDEDGNAVVHKDAAILSLDGFTALLGSIADSLDDMHKQGTGAKEAKRQADLRKAFDD